MSQLLHCVICGYIHEGEAPPAFCPICGASKENFELEVPEVETEENKIYSCLNCEYLHQGDVPPAVCPVCGFSSEHFELVDPLVVKQRKINIRKVVILGGGIAALSAAETLREQSESVEITLVTNEEKLPYYRLNLTRYICDDIDASELRIHPQYWYDIKNIRVLKNRIVIDILKEDRKVILSDETELLYDKLIIALGAHPFIPPVHGASLPGILTLRSAEDAKDILAASKGDRSFVIIGGGVLGLETAAALAMKGNTITIAEGSSWLMPRQLNSEAARYVEKSLTDLGIKVAYDFRTVDISSTDEGFEVTSNDGRSIVADTVLFATGVRPNTYLARKAGLEVNRGLVIDNFMQTSDENIYAAGDVTEHYGVTYGLWNIAQYQGKIAAYNVTGSRMSFGGVPRSNALKVLGIDVFSIGEIHSEDASYLNLKRMDEDSYLYVNIRDQQIVGSIAIGYKTVHTN